MKTAVDYDKGPIAVRYPRVNGLGVDIDAELQPIPIGEWETVQTGDTAALLAVGPMLQVAAEAGELLKREGLSLRIVNARFIKPLDENMLLRLADERIPLVVLEEGAQLGGLGSAVLEFYSLHGIHHMDVRIVGIPDAFIEHGSIKEQRAEAGLTADRVASVVTQLLPRRKQRATGQ
ncbi:transketolase C-terminal domain-containing protein, partial [Paenibacillus darwinianus]